MGLKKAIAGLMATGGIEIASTEHLRKMVRNAEAHFDRAERFKAYLGILAMARGDLVHALSQAAPKATSQLGQELFVLEQTGIKTGGYFIEFGATNGISLSNSALLEKSFGWTGILAEPAKGWHSDLRNNRSCKIDDRCVWKETGAVLEFVEAGEGEYSTLGTLVRHDMHSERRLKTTNYNVKTISLNDLLAYHQAPKHIDYLSVDTEGSEFEILKVFDFDRYEINIITCEHNYTSDRDRIHELLHSKGYVRKCEDLSRWDDWYVRR